MLASITEIITGKVRHFCRLNGLLPCSPSDSQKGFIETIPIVLFSILTVTTLVITNVMRENSFDIRNRAADSVYPGGVCTGNGIACDANNISKFACQNESWVYLGSCTTPSNTPLPESCALRGGYCVPSSYVCSPNNIITGTNLCPSGQKCADIDASCQSGTPSKTPTPSPKPLCENSGPSGTACVSATWTCGYNGPTGLCGSGQKCGAYCTPPPTNTPSPAPRYGCANGQCVKSTSGEYLSLSECSFDCKPPTPTPRKSNDVGCSSNAECASNYCNPIAETCQNPAQCPASCQRGCSSVKDSSGNYICNSYCSSTKCPNGCLYETSSGGQCNSGQICVAQNNSCDPNTAVSALKCCSGTYCSVSSSGAKCVADVAQTNCPASCANGCSTGTTICKPYCKITCGAANQICSPTSSGGSCISNPACLNDGQSVGQGGCCKSNISYQSGSIYICGAKPTNTPTKSPTPTVNAASCLPIKNATECGYTPGCFWVNQSNTCIASTTNLPTIYNLGSCTSACPNGGSCFCPLTCNKLAVGPTDSDRTCGGIEPTPTVRITTTPVQNALCYFGSTSCSSFNRYSATGCSNCPSGVAACCGAEVTANKICTPGASVCSNNIVRVCNSLGIGWTDLACGTGLSCSGNRCIKPPTAGDSCSQPHGTGIDGQLYCCDGQLKSGECVAAIDTGDTTKLPNGTWCFWTAFGGGSCANCTAGTTYKINGKDFCGAGPVVSIQLPIHTGEVCLNTSAPGTPQVTGCKCIENGQLINVGQKCPTVPPPPNPGQCIFGSTCAAKGRYVATECSSCPTAGGQASCCGDLIPESAKRCEPNTVTCSADVVYACKSDGTDFIIKPCASGLTCGENGTCVSKPSPTPVPPNLLEQILTPVVQNYVDSLQFYYGEEAANAYLTGIVNGTTNDPLFGNYVQSCMGTNGLLDANCVGGSTVLGGGATLIAAPVAYGIVSAPAAYTFAGQWGSTYIPYAIGAGTTYLAGTQAYNTVVNSGVANTLSYYGNQVSSFTNNILNTSISVPSFVPYVGGTQLGNVGTSIVATLTAQGAVNGIPLDFQLAQMGFGGSSYADDLANTVDDYASNRLTYSSQQPCDILGATTDSVENKGEVLGNCTDYIPSNTAKTVKITPDLRVDIIPPDDSQQLIEHYAQALNDPTIQGSQAWAIHFTPSGRIDAADDLVTRNQDLARGISSMFQFSDEAQATGQFGGNAPDFLFSYTNPTMATIAESKLGFVRTGITVGPDIELIYNSNVPGMLENIESNRDRLQRLVNRYQ